ncbi:hypothetical protein [Hyphococcus sp.]|uniref:hypothetical protein n=1 Tax=Hyphococcus sp. TaxID=2038636 RepID=UPI003CCC3DAD
MSAANNNLSPKGRQAARERAEAAALEEVAVEADKQREKTTRLRNMRLANKKASAARFQAWQSRQNQDPD